jgi:hypothetical protein
MQAGASCKRVTRDALQCVVSRRDGLEARLATVLTIFVAQAAIQFVLADDLPSSSYVNALGQMVATGYVLLLLIGVEAVVIWRLTTWHAHNERCVCCCRCSTVRPVQPRHVSMQARTRRQQDSACVRACVRAYVFACVCGCGCMCVCRCIRGGCHRHHCAVWLLLCLRARDRWQQHKAARCQLAYSHHKRTGARTAEPEQGQRNSARGACQPVQQLPGAPCDDLLMQDQACARRLSPAQALPCGHGGEGSVRSSTPAAASSLSVDIPSGSNHAPPTAPHNTRR